MSKKPTEKQLHTSGKMLGVGKDGLQTGGIKSVSYTHLTLPTIYSV